MSDRIIGAIFARGGSKGIPRKNIRELAGKPLIAYAIEAARASSLVERVIVSTDDQEIADVAREFGADVPFLRPAELARDDSPEWLAWQHAIDQLEADEGIRPSILVSIPATSPFREPGDIDRCIELLQQGDADLVITVTPADRNPYFNMVTLDAEQRVQLAISSGKVYYRRQDAPAVYDMTTVAYAARTDYVMRAQSWFEGRTKAAIIARERSLDIDTEADWQLAEYLMNQKKKLATS